MPERALPENPNLIALGWRSALDDAITPLVTEFPGAEPARVAVEHRGRYVLYSAHGELSAEVTGRLRYLAQGREDFPAVGDWVLVRTRPTEGNATIHAILPRHSAFSRRAAGTRADEQVVAANVDVVLIVTSLNRELSLRRLERYLTLTWESDAKPVIVLNKADLATDIAASRREVEGIALGVPVHAVSAMTGDGIEELRKYYSNHRTIALLGSSGVGKSSLINRLAGASLLCVNDVRAADDKGRHTTSYRQLVVLPDGGLIIDTPGMRELQLWEAEGGLAEAFDDVEALAVDCRFRDCEHLSEPNCAVTAAVAEGLLPAERLESYHKLRRELAFVERKQDARLQAEQTRAIRVIMRNARANRKDKGR